MKAIFSTLIFWASLNASAGVSFSCVEKPTEEQLLEITKDMKECINCEISIVEATEANNLGSKPSPIKVGRNVLFNQVGALKGPPRIATELNFSNTI